MRRKHLAALAVFAIAIVTWGCKHANAEVQDTDSGTATGKTLVVYFSHQVPYEVDGVTGASYALKLIRERAGLADKTFTQDQLMDQIEHQCLLEFFGEGHRFDDLKRWYTTNEIKTILKANDKQGADNFQERNRYYPIPTGELNNNSAMQQIDLWK